MDSRDFDRVELCLDSQLNRGNVMPARATWLRGFKDGYRGEAYHSGVFFTTGISKHINDQYMREMEAYKKAKAEYDADMAAALGDDDAIADLREPKQPRRSLKKYKGAHWAPYFMLDIDTRRVGPKWELKELEGGGHKWIKRTKAEGEAWLEGNPSYVEDTDAARVEALEVIRCIGELGVPAEKLIICFSGGKGFHIYVPTRAFDPEPCTNFIYRIRWMVETALVPMVSKEKILYPEDSIDWQVFDRLKALRAVNSKHGSGGWKVPIAYRTLQSMSFEQIRDRATGPVLDYEHPNWRDVAPSDELRKLWDDPVCEAYKKPTEADGPEGEALDVSDRKGAFQDGGRITFDAEKVLGFKRRPPQRPLCVVKLSQENVGSGNRHQACLMLLTTWKKEGYTRKQALQMGRAWLALQKGSDKDADYLDRQIESIWDDNFKWGCNHPLAKANCFKQCYLFPEAERSEQLVLHHFPEIIHDLLDREREDVLYFLPYPPFKDQVKIRPKQVIFLVAETATGKTAFLLDVCRANSQGIDFLRSGGDDVVGGCGFISLEMPREELVERGLQWVTGEDQRFVGNLLNDQLDAEADGEADPAWEEAKKRLHHHYEHVWVSEEDGVDIKKLKAIIRKGKEEHGIGLWTVDYMGRMAGKGMNQHEKISHLAREMKTVAREMDIALFVLVQVGRSVSEKGAPGLRSGRGSGEIEESADILITAHRPDKHEDKDLEEGKRRDKQRADASRPSGYRVSMIVQKGRSGGIGLQSDLWFEGKNMRFTPLKEHEAQLRQYQESYDYLDNI